MEKDKDASYVVRKGDVGIYKTLGHCQLQSCFTGYGLSKEAEEFLASHGLKNAICSVSASDDNNDLFGNIVPCPFQQPASRGKVSDKVSHPKRLHEEAVGSTSFSTNAFKKQLNVENCMNAQSAPSNVTPVFSSLMVPQKGNPGQSGAGAVLCAEDGSIVCRLHEGMGMATHNVAEYRAVILVLKYTLKKGFKHIHVQGDPKLVCVQIQGLWKINNQNLAGLCKEAKELKDKFLSFQINHVLRDFNSEADAQENKGIYLKGVVEGIY